ncbi:hypothetical protein [Bradyrhizobium sp.]|uniref:hypothetical protein n=1 Tax=Bradyrhizobium sp. TaxID=376 RepID=UPI001DB21801|nr:hypothetical protein [Bradyrhizobium sp.]MBI5318339.1 hypothetical protein [Bradyrhizobium sp.]
MLEALALWLTHQRERTVLGVPGTDQFDQLAKDLGVSANELSYLVNSARDPLQLPDMLRALGIDEAALRRARPTLLSALEDVCEQCTVIGRCKYAIDRGTAASDYAQFCPNAGSLTILRAQQAGDP